MKRIIVCTLLVGLFTCAAWAQEHRVAVIEGPPKVEGLSEKDTRVFAARGIRVLRGSSRTVCEIWPCTQWVAESDFKATPQRLYPFQPGQLMGILHFPRRGKDFRDQTIDQGWYTLRYGLQPTDGNHEGTSPTRDFLLLVAASRDKLEPTKPLKELLAASAEAAGTSHPAMLCLQRATQASEESPSIRHDDANDWWIVQFSGNTLVDGQTKPLAVEFVVVGQASE